MKQQKQKSIFKYVYPYLGKKTLFWHTSLALGAISAILNLLPFILIWLISRNIFTDLANINIQSISFYAWAALISAFVSLVVYFAALTFSHLAAFHTEVQMRKIAMQKITKMPLGYFSKNPSGKIRKIIDEGSSATHTLIAHQAPDLAAGVIVPILLLIFIFAIDWRFGLVCLIPIGLGIFAMMTMMSDVGKEFQKKYMDCLEEMSSEAVEYIRGIGVVKTFGGSVFAFKNFVKSITKYKEMVYAYTYLWNKPMAFYTIIVQSTALFLVPFGVFLINGQNISDTLSNFLFYLLISPGFALVFMRIMVFEHARMTARQSFERLDKILDYKQMDFNGEKKPKKFDIEFKNVSFRYSSTEKNAISDLSFKLESGKSLALVGASGGGKTTIARLIARFWDADSGEILIGGINIKDIPKEYLMQNISFIFQNSKLFKTSIRENITLSNKKASEEEIQKAIELSQSKEIIEKLKDGLDTQIGSKGIYLSGGEQQRISIARAFLKNAPIVLLDEATAFADPENEFLIQKAFAALGRDKTTITIAHRLTSVVNADKILVIDNGKIAEAGTHKDLLEKNGLYKQMWEEYQKSIDWKIKEVQNG